MAESPNLQK